MDDGLVGRAQRGDRDAFDALVGASVNRLYSVAYRVLRSEAAAEDAVQDAMLRAWRDLRALREPGRFDAWLYQLLLNACRDEMRRQRRRPVAVLSAAIEPVDEHDGVGNVDRRDQLERAFRALSADHRLVLVLYHVQGLRAAEIAELLGIPEGTVTSRLHYGTRALRGALDAGARVTTNAETVRVVR